MKKILLNWVMALGAVALLTACNGNSDIVVEDGQILPTCTITQGVPLTGSQITVHVICTGGNVVIDQATVTVDGQVKSLDFDGASIDDYIGFLGLQDNTVYTVVMEAIIDGNTITKTINITTDDIPLDTIAPIITITGGTTSLVVGGAYTAPVVTATDDIDGDISGSVVVGGDVVDVNAVGTYTITYDVTDSSGNSATQRTHIVTVTAVPNNAPTCENFTVVVGIAGITSSNNTANVAPGSFTATGDLSLHINDVDSGDTLTTAYVGSGVLGGSLTIGSATVSGNNATIIAATGFGDAYIDYTVSDGTDTSAACRVTFTNLAGI